MKHQLEDYQITENCIPIYYDNTAAICLSKNLILHSRAKHIEIKHHFIKDYVQKGVSLLKKCHFRTEFQTVLGRKFPTDFGRKSVFARNSDK